MTATRQRRFRIAVRQFPPFEAAIRAQWNAFEDLARSGLQLDLVPLDLHALEDALFTSGGMQDGAWDVAFVATDWIAAMHARGCAIDVAPYLEHDPPPGFPHGWSPSLLRLQRVNAAILGVPYHDGPECLVYRRDLFENPLHQRSFEQSFHQPLAPPTTWAEFHRIARFFHRPAEGLYGTVFAAAPDGHNSVYDFLLQLWTRGGELVSPTGFVHFTTPAAEAALSFYREIVTDRSAAHPDCLTLDSVAAGRSFAAGEVAMMINWFGFAAHAHSPPDSAVRGQVVRNQVAIADIPAGPGGGSVSLNVYWVLALPTGSPHRELAWRFLRHTQTPAMDKLTSLHGGVGCRLSTWSDPDVQRSVPFYAGLDSLHRHAREIPQRQDWPRIVAVIDTLITQTIGTTTPVRALLQAADASLQSSP